MLGRSVGKSWTTRWALLASLAMGASASAEEWRVSVRGLPSAGETPVVAAIDAKVPSGDYSLIPDSGGPSRPARVWSDGGATYLGAVLRPSASGGPASFTLAPDVKSELSKPGVEIRPSGKNLEILVQGKPLTTYVADEPSKPYFFPVIGPTGQPITRAYPMRDVEGETRDHPHQRSFWFTHGLVNGYDFWASDPKNKANPKFGSIRETSRQASGGAAVGVLKTTDDWLDNDGKKICEDERVVTIYDAEKVRVIDVDVTIRATEGPVTFGDTKEGMFGIRVASSMDVDKKTGGKITNAEGVNDAAAWGKASPWVDYVGPVAGKTVGVAILNHPDSFRYPTAWHVRTYGLFAANPFGGHDFGLKEKGDHTIPAGGQIKFRYRVILHEGDTESARIAAAFKSYATPPTVVVKAE